MKLNLLHSVGDIGIITDYNSLVRDKIEIEVGCDGILCVSNTDTLSCATKQKTYNSKSGKVVIEDFDLPQGTNRVVFTRSDGAKYNCGQIQRNGRFIQIVNPLDKLTVALALAYNEQGEKLTRVEEELKTIKQQYGICIM